LKAPSGCYQRRNFAPIRNIIAKVGSAYSYKMLERYQLILKHLASRLRTGEGLWVEAVFRFRLNLVYLLLKVPSGCCQCRSFALVKNVIANVSPAYP
jgi:hypothetical protein